MILPLPPAGCWSAYASPNVTEGTFFAEQMVAYGEACAAKAVAAERDRIVALLEAIREHWVKANGEDSLSVGALDVIAEVIADGSYVESGPNVQAQAPA
jgi:hypothetical protein